MISNSDRYRRTGSVGSDPYAFVVPADGHLTVAAAVGSDVVHLVVVDGVARASWTLCAYRVSRRLPTELFGESGCWFCASIGLSTGHTFAEDRHGSRVELRTWLVARRLRSSPRQVVPGSTGP